MADPDEIELDVEYVEDDDWGKSDDDEYEDWE